ncbi:MAG: hemolysin family protein [Fibrobacteria bacterium]
MNGIGFEIVFILILVLANGVFAMTEIAVVSARKSRLQQWANEGNHRAQNALDLANSPNRFLATIQVVITLITLLTGAYGGSTIADIVASHMENIPIISQYRERIALTLVVFLIGFLQVVFGELVPKTIALNHAEKIASLSAWPMQIISKIAYPAVYLLGFVTDFILRLMGSKPSSEPPVTGDEINVMIAQGTEAGVFQESQQDMVESVIELNERRINSIMTPRPDVVWLDVEATFEENREKILGSSYSRFPVCRGGLDEVLGVIHTKDMLADCISGKPIDLQGHVRKALTIPETIPVLKSLESFKESGIHIALVIDEYASLQGLVTLNDIMESIVGEIDTHDQKEERPGAVKREDGSWLVDGMQPIEDFKELMEIDYLPEEDTDTYQTLGGFVMMKLGRIPKAGEHFLQDQVRYEVMDMDGNRVDKVLVKKLEPEEEQEPESRQSRPGSSRPALPDRE